MCVGQPASNLQYLTEMYFTFVSELEFTELNSFTFAQGQCHGLKNDQPDLWKQKNATARICEGKMRSTYKL